MRALANETVRQALGQIETQTIDEDHGVHLGGDPVDDAEWDGAGRGDILERMGALVDPGQVDGPQSSGNGGAVSFRRRGRHGDQGGAVDGSALFGIMTGQGGGVVMGPRRRGGDDRQGLKRAGQGRIAPTRPHRAPAWGVLRLQFQEACGGGGWVEVREAQERRSQLGLGSGVDHGVGIVDVIEQAARRLGQIEPFDDRAVAFASPGFESAPDARPAAFSSGQQARSLVSRPFARIEAQFLDRA
ncbi:hypothetical protein D3C72_614330 [compost metagenome]